MSAPVKNWFSLDCTMPYATLERSTAKRQPKKSWDKSSRPFASASRELFSNRGLSMIFDEHFGVIVIGAGHAGCEAASAAARLGVSTALLTLNLDLIGQMSCNPAIGGIGKGHLVREIDALGGIMGRVIDRTGIQFRLLNRSRGPAVQSPRAQADRSLYRREMRRCLEATPNLHLRQGTVVDLLVHGGSIHGLEMHDTRRIGCTAVVVATGTFLNGLVHTGRRTHSAGRA